MITVVGNLKGGSGKSTVTFNLGVWLASRGRSVGLFDLDPQQTLSDVAEVRQEEGFAPTLSVATDTRNLKRKLRNGTFDEVLVDVGSADMASMKTALASADRVLVPVPPSQADIWSTQRFLGIIAETGASPEICVFVNRADTHRAVRESDEAAEALASLSGIRFLNRRLHQRTVYRRSFSEGLGVFELEPAGKAATEFRALAAALYPIGVPA